MAMGLATVLLGLLLTLTPGAWRARSIERSFACAGPCAFFAAEVLDDAHDRALMRLGRNFEPELLDEAEHRVVVAQHQALHGLHAARTRRVDECLHEEAGDAGSVPVVRDDDSEFATAAAGVRDIARLAHKASRVLANERQVPLVVHVGEEMDQSGVHRGNGLYEPKAPGLRRQGLEEALFKRLIVGADRADEHRPPVGKAPFAREVGGILGHAASVAAALRRGLIQVNGQPAGRPILKPIFSSKGNAMERASDKLMQDLRAVMVDAEELLKATAGQTGERIEKVRARAEQSVSKARQRMQAAGQDLQAAAESAAREVNDRVQENPWTAIGVAAGVGLVLGIMLGRK